MHTHLSLHFLIKGLELEIEYNQGIYIKGVDLWLDAEKGVDFSFISHAHIDHVARHKKILATPQTAKLYEHRLGKTNAKITEFNKPTKIKGAKVELFPSGHILGASQILIEKGGVRLVYTGDFKLRGCLTAEKAEIKKCDILIMESTFGLPHYLFPPRKEIVQRIINFVDHNFKRNTTPVILAYSLGKAQEAMKILGNHGFKLSIHSSILKLAMIYQQFGVKFKNFYKYNSNDLKGKILLAPPYLKNSKMIESIPQKRIALLTGWGIDENACWSYGVDEVFPLSDHADFSELIEYAKKASPQKIYTVHGFPEFVQHLKNEGFDAEELKIRRNTHRLSQELLLNYDLFRTL